jgi:hypothetical protein
LARQYFPFYRESPIIDADPRPEVLAASLSDVISRRKEYPSLAQQGWTYVNHHHDHMKVAGSYLALWSQAKNSRPARRGLRRDAFA